MAVSHKFEWVFCNLPTYQFYIVTIFFFDKYFNKLSSEGGEFEMKNKYVRALFTDHFAPYKRQFCQSDVE
jgi:hypothetical protein